MEKNVLGSFKNLNPQGRELVVVVRQYPRSWYAGRIDFTDYAHKDIWAVIPAWKDANGVLTSIKTGNVINLGKHDEVRPEAWGVAFVYPDGADIQYIRFWVPGKKEPEYRFVERQCRDCECIVIKAHGEELKEAPKRERR